MSRHHPASINLSDAQRILMRNRHLFKNYKGISEISVARAADGVIYFVVTCKSIEAAADLPKIDAIDQLPIRVEIEDVNQRVAASAGD